MIDYQAYSQKICSACFWKALPQYPIDSLDNLDSLSLPMQSILFAFISAIMCQNYSTKVETSTLYWYHYGVSATIANKKCYHPTQVWSNCNYIISVLCWSAHSPSYCYISFFNQNLKFTDIYFINIQHLCQKLTLNVLHHTVRYSRKVKNWFKSGYAINPRPSTQGQVCLGMGRQWIGVQGVLGLIPEEPPFLGVLVSNEFFVGSFEVFFLLLFLILILIIR